MTHSSLPPAAGRALRALPARVRELHDVAGASVWTGRADVERGRSLASRVVATLFGLPPAGRDQALRVTFQVDGDREIWSRSFGDAVFRSVQCEQWRAAARARRAEHIRVCSGDFGRRDGAQLRGVRFLGVPLPRFLAPSVHTFESEREGRLSFRGGSEPAAARPHRALCGVAGAGRPRSDPVVSLSNHGLSHVARPSTGSGRG